MRVVTALLLPLLLQAPSHTQTPASSAPGMPAPPSPAMATYRNDTLRLSYAYPSNFADATAMVGPAMEAAMGQGPAAGVTAKCITLPFSRMQPGNTELGLVVMMRADAVCFKRKFNAGSVAEFAQGEAQGITASGAKTNFASPVSYTVAGRPASMVRGSFTLPTGQTLQSLVSCVLDEPDIACWQFLSGKAATLGGMTAFPVTFDGSPATPLVPAQVLTGK